MILKVTYFHKAARNLSDLKMFPANMFLFDVKKKKKKFALQHFLTPKKLHSSSTLKANIFMFLYISVVVRFYLVLEGWRGKVGEGGVKGRLNIFLKEAHCVGLVKCFTIFHFNLNFWNSTNFQHFVTSIKTLKLSRQFGLQK